MVSIVEMLTFVNTQNYGTDLKLLTFMFEGLNC